MFDQKDIFAELFPKFVITKPIKLIELFAGIGSQAKSLERLGVPFEHHKVVEFDKYCIRSYNAIHGTNFEPSDIRDVHAADLEITDTEHFTYLLTYLLLSLPRSELCRIAEGHEKRRRNQERTVMGSGEDSGRVRTESSPSPSHGKRSPSNRKQEHRRLPCMAIQTGIARLSELC